MLFRPHCYSYHQEFFLLDPRLYDAEEHGIPAWRDVMLQRGDCVVATRPFCSGNLEVCIGCAGVVTGFTLLLRSKLCHIICTGTEEQLQCQRAAAGNGSVAQF